MNNGFLQHDATKSAVTVDDSHLRQRYRRRFASALERFGSARFSPDMNFYLVRHGDAVAAVENAERPLSRIGREQVQRAAREMLERGSEVSRIYHSGILRAKQTAEILAKAFPPNLAVEQHAGLLPEDDPAVVKAELGAAECSIMLVGHLPYLKRLAALLISGDPERAVVDFLPATVLCCSKAHGRWKINWILGAPEI
jgi:phosphohistidine phosphatase